MCEVTVVLELEPGDVRAMLELAKVALAERIEKLRQVSIEEERKARVTNDDERRESFRASALCLIGSDLVGVYRRLLAVVPKPPPEAEPGAVPAGDVSG